MADAMVPPVTVADLDEIRAKQKALRAGRRCPQVLETRGAQDAAEQALAAQDTAHLWTVLSLVLSGRDGDAAEMLTQLAVRDPDLVTALGEAGRGVAEAVAKATRGLR